MKDLSLLAILESSADFDHGSRLKEATPKLSKRVIQVGCPRMCAGATSLEWVAHPSRSH